MTNINEIMIIGGGKSIQDGLNQGLQPLLATKFVIGTNYSFKTFSSTFLCFQDREFYVPDYAKNYPDEKTIRHPDIYNELKQLPLIIGININGIEEFKLDNTILLDKKEMEKLTGIFALKLAEKIMEKGTIYLLGFDWNRRIGLPERDPNYNPKTDLQIHYYNNIKHRGVGYVGYYENHNPDKIFVQFIKKDVKIFNVSLQSNINCFPKISYEHMYTLLNKEKINQKEARQEIKNKFNHDLK
jgi:hypothetical protein